MNGMSPGDIALYFLYVLTGAVLIVLMLRAICEQQPPAAEGVHLQRSPIVAVRPPAPAPAAPVPPVALPYFPYAARRGIGGGRETVVCAICLDPLRRGQPCSEVPACRHTFHRDCVGAWVRRSNTCPLCRVKIVPRSRDKHGVVARM